MFKETDFIYLNNRAVIEIKGNDSKNFLQGLITNDINNVTEKNSIYALFLSPVGRFLFDFFIIKKEESFLIDCNKKEIDMIIKKLSFYKLRAQIEIIKREDLAILNFFKKEMISFLDKNHENIVIKDPRHHEMGFRAIVDHKLAKNFDSNSDQYHFKRLNLKIADENDLTFDKSLPIEFGFDQLNAINYQKGCFLGQETTARMHYKGVLRKNIYLIELLSSSLNGAKEIIDNEGKERGEILSFYNFKENHKEKTLALALIKDTDLQGNKILLENINLFLNNHPIKLIK